MISFHVNGTLRRVEVSADTPLLWVLRDHLQLTGTKFGCGSGLCGACTVLVDGAPKRSCITEVGEVEGKKVVTIEGIPADHPVKAAWLVKEVSQCGYCQPGQILSATALLDKHPNPSEAQIDAAMSGNICRCGSYPRIRRAIQAAAEKAAKGGKKS